MKYYYGFHYSKGFAIGCDELWRDVVCAYMRLNRAEDSHICLYV